jgi:hypothetical protein
VVLKLTPDPSVADGEAAALRASAANPQAVDLLDTDAETGALLLEKLEPGNQAQRPTRIPAIRGNRRAAYWPAGRSRRRQLQTGARQ